MVQNLLAVQETWVRSLGGESPLEEGMATHSTILAWRIPWTEEPGGLWFVGSQRVRHDRAAHTFTGTPREWSSERHIHQLYKLHISLAIQKGFLCYFR